jgi:hypothetical protein
VTDACTLVPAELAKKLVPGASAPRGEPYPPRCTVTNGTSVLEITIDTGPPDPVKGAEAIPGLGEGGYLERPAPDDAFLIVIVARDEPTRRLLVEVAGHDGKDHKDDAIAVAREVLAQLK